MPLWILVLNKLNKPFGYQTNDKQQQNILYNQEYLDSAYAFTRKTNCNYTLSLHFWRYHYFHRFFRQPLLFHGVWCSYSEFNLIWNKLLWRDANMFEQLHHIPISTSVSLILNEYWAHPWTYVDISCPIKYVTKRTCMFRYHSLLRDCDTMAIIETWHVAIHRQWQMGTGLYEWMIGKFCII